MDALHLLKTPENDFYGTLGVFKDTFGIFNFFRGFHAPDMAGFEKITKNLKKTVENRLIEHIQKTKKCSKKSKSEPNDLKMVPNYQKSKTLPKISTIFEIDQKLDELEQFFTFGPNCLLRGQVMT